MSLKCDSALYSDNATVEISLKYYFTAAKPYIVSEKYIIN